jgi:predicted GH43/DUF377 family glycosyl hydrolase
MKNLIVSFCGILLVGSVVSAYTIQDRHDYGSRLAISGTTSTDGIYDWGASSFKDGGTYRMWWCRQNTYDVIYYADSWDGLHWYNTQQVLAARGGSSQEQLSVGKPAVVKVGTTYYMFYEAPKLFTNYPYGEYANQIFLATSTNGTTWTKYPNNDNPQPVISVPSNITTGAYGIGQPSVFYTNGYFYLFYTCNLTGWPDQIRFAMSTSATNWGSYTTHSIACQGGSGAGVTWNKAINKYVMLYTAQSSLTPNPDSPDTVNVHVFTSTDGYNWENGTGGVYYQPYLWNIAVNANKLTASPFANPKVRGYPQFVGTDQYGLVSSSTMFINYMQGTMPSSGQDWRSTSGTWDLYALTFKLNNNTDPLIFHDGLVPLDAGTGSLYKIWSGTLDSYVNWASYCMAVPGRENDYVSIPHARILLQPAGHYFAEHQNMLRTATGQLYFIENFTLYAYSSWAHYISYSGNVSGNWFEASETEYTNVANDLPYGGYRP